MSNFRLCLGVRMKNWLSIGQFAKKVALTQRTLRVYEDAGLISAYSRGDNSYRYYTEEQIALVDRIKQLKSFGFSLGEIKSLLTLDSEMSSEKLIEIFEKRFQEICEDKKTVQSAYNEVYKILTSLKEKNKGLGLNERRFIMASIEKTSVVVTGIYGLDLTAKFIRSHLESGGQLIPVMQWDGQSSLSIKKPYILIIPENLLNSTEVDKLSPDIVVIKEISGSSEEVNSSYLKLFKSAGDHSTTIMNADDRAIVSLAANENIRKGRTYYFSKNSAMKMQISKIGGAVSTGDRIEVFGFNRKLESEEIKVEKVMGHLEETAYLASLATVMDFGIPIHKLKNKLA